VVGPSNAAKKNYAPTDPCCHGNEIRDKMGYNSVCVRDICEIFASAERGSGLGCQTLPTEFHLNRPPSPWQRNWDKMGYNSVSVKICIGSLVAVVAVAGVVVV